MTAQPPEPPEPPEASFRLADLPARAREAVMAADTRVDAAAPTRRSLSPHRARAQGFGALCEGLLSAADLQAGVAAAFAQGLAGLGVAQLESFPENLFWDLDFPAAQVLAQGRRAADPAAEVADLFARMSRLQRLYGRDTAIRFRYVHDFTYGYDWVKWVAREAEQTGAVGPFDREFLAYMERRAHELLALIGGDDRTYPRLRDDRPRNPFGFSREPDDEIALLSELARRLQIPVQAWAADAKPDWDRPYAELRVQCAGELGLLVDGAA